MPTYLEGLAVQFYRGIGPEIQYIAPFSEMNFFVGANNAGKSIILNLIKDRLPRVDVDRRQRLHTAVRNNGVVDEYRGQETGVFAAAVGLTVASFVEPAKEQYRANLEATRFVSVDPLAEICSAPRKDGCIWITPDDRNSSWNLFQDVDGAEVLNALCRNDLIALSRSTNLIDARLATRGGSSNQHSNHQIAQIFRTILAMHRVQLPECLAIPAKREIDADSDSFDDLSGKGLIKHLAEIQNPDFNERERKDIFDNINAFVREVTDRPDALLEVPNHRKHLLVHMDNKVLPLSSLGTGIHEVILIAAFCTIHQKKIMCIEEPEIHLHPVLQRKLIRYLQDHTENQYFIATHSAAFIDTPSASVFHVRNDGVQTYVEAAITKGEQRKICDDLGYRASDILQANAVIWVEGPSDRTYIRHWLKALDDRLIEGVHYTIMFYGGGLITHLSVDDSAVDDFIKLRDLNRNIAVVIDSDKDGSRAHLKPAARRLKEEMSKDGGVVWITKGREIENYVPHDRLQGALRELHPKVYGAPLSGGVYDHAFYFERKGAKTGADNVYKAGDKVGAAAIICSEGDGVDFDVLDLKERVTKLAQMIVDANGMGPRR